MVQVNRKKKETVLSLLKRFQRKLRQSGNLAGYKTSQYKNRNKSALTKKKEALVRTKRQQRRSKLYKMGKIGNKPNTRRR
jgi:ElaB/YqjD/DUF883 family membrane-anchored ribosome-binding protein